jgi:hypothetical protein
VTKTPTSDCWWFHRKYLDQGDDGTTHDDQCCDHRHFVTELNEGWRFWSPAGRLETVISIAPADRIRYWWRIQTKETPAADPDWTWRLPGDDRVHAVPANPRWKEHLRFVDIGPGSQRNSDPVMLVVPAHGYDIPSFKVVLVEARYLGAGRGWRFRDRPDGGDETVTDYPSKAKARTAVLTAARRHAKILGLEIVKEEDLAHFV